jgi:hypothetical protein
VKPRVSDNARENKEEMFHNLKQRPASCAPGRVQRLGIAGIIMIIVVVVAAVVWRPYLSIAANGVAQKIGPQKTVADRLRQYSAPAQRRLAPHFARAGVSYPPAQLALLGFKKERRLEVHAAGRDGIYQFVRAYPILGASGGLGPKLREGDAQVPEGLYAISFLNPNSLYHLSLRVNYPNDFDRAQAKRDGRQQLGGDCMIHGSIASIGCLAMGDEAAEDLFVLAAMTGIQNVRVVLSPVDFRTKTLDSLPSSVPVWTQGLYTLIRSELSRYHVGPTAALKEKVCSTT